MLEHRNIFSLRTGYKWLFLIAVLLFGVNAYAQLYTVDNVSLYPNPFSPNGDGVRDEMEISFYLNDSGTVQIEIGQGNPFTILFDTTIQGRSGLNRIKWDGKDNLGTVLPDGKYGINIIFKGSKYSLKNGIIINTTPPEIEMISSAPNPFSPDGDGYQDVHTVKYRVKNSNVHYLGLIKVDFSTQSVNFVADQHGNTGPFSIPYSDGMYLMLNRPFYYDGMITAPSTVKYTLTIGGSHSYPVSVSRGQDLYKLGQNYYPYHFVSPSIGLDVSPEFNVGEDYLALYGIEGNSTFSIYDNNGSPISLSDLYPIYFGSFSDNLSDPTNIDVTLGAEYHITVGATEGSFPGNALKDGRYIYRIKVTNAAEHATEENGELLVNSDPITITSSVAPDHISPENQDGLFDQAIIQYQTSEDAYVTVKIHDQKHKIIRSLVSERLIYEKQGGYVLWDGKDDNGDFVASGDSDFFIVEITARDRYIPSDVTSMQLVVTVDNSLPTSPVLHQPVPDTFTQPHVMLSGITSETNCDIILFLNGINRGIVGKTENYPGYFEFSVTLEEGLNNVYIKLKDKVANLGTSSNIVSLFLDSQPPQITILTPEENKVFNVRDIDATAKIIDNGSGVDKVRFGFSVDGEDAIKWINGIQLAGDTYGATYSVPIGVTEQKISFIVEAIDLLDNKAVTPTPRHFSYKLPTSIAPPLFVKSVPEKDSNVRVIANNRVEVYVESEVDLITDPAKTTIILYHPSGQGITHGLGGNITYHQEGGYHVVRLNFTQPFDSSGEDDGDYRLLYFAESILNQSITDEIYFKYDTIKPYVEAYHLNDTDALFAIGNQYFYNKPLDSISVDVNDVLSGVDFATNLTRVVLYDSNNEVVPGVGSVSGSTIKWKLTNTINPTDTHQTYRIYVRATDKAGNQLVVNRNFILLKTEKPSITSTYPTEDSFINTLNNNRVTVRVTDKNGFGIDRSKTSIELSGAGIDYTDGNSATLSVQSVTANTYDISLTLSSPLSADGSHDGSYQVKLKVVDLTGEEINDTYNFTFDSQKPVMSSPTVYNNTPWNTALTPNLKVSEPIDYFSVEITDILSGVNTTSPNTYLRLHKADSSIVPGTLEITGNTLYWRLTNTLPNDGTADGSYYLSYSAIDKAGNLLKDRITFQVLNPLAPVVDVMSPLAGSTITSLTPSVISLEFTDERGIDLDDYNKTYLKLTTPQNRVISHNNGATLSIVKDSDTKYKMKLTLSDELKSEGIYRVDYRIENNQGYLDSGVWSFTLDNATPIITNIVANLANGTEQPLSDGTIIYRPITSIRATVSDKTSNIDQSPGMTYIKVTNQGGAEITGSLSYTESTKTLLFSFDKELDELDMRYDMEVKAADEHGNFKEEKLSFNIKSMKTEIVEVYPATGSKTNATINYVYVKFKTEDVVVVDELNTILKLKTPSGSYIDRNSGAKQSITKSGNLFEVRLTLDKPLSLVGDDDGVFELSLDISTDLFKEGPHISHFTYDRVVPYYTNIPDKPYTSIIHSVQADYFDLTSGVNFAPNMTRLTLLDANSNIIPGVRVVEGNTIKWILNIPIEATLENAGTYYLSIQITDNAGNTKTDKLTYELIVDTLPELISCNPPNISGYISSFKSTSFEANFYSVYPIIEKPDNSYIRIIHPNGDIISDNHGGKMSYSKDKDNYKLTFTLATEISTSGEDDGAYTIEIRAQNSHNLAFETSYVLIYDSQPPVYDNLQVIHADGTTDITTPGNIVHTGITSIKVRYFDSLAGVYSVPNITNVSLFDPSDNVVSGVLSLVDEGVYTYATWTLDSGYQIKADGSQDGTYTIKMKVADNAGNRVITEIPFEIVTVVAPKQIKLVVDALYNAHLSWEIDKPINKDLSYFEVFRSIDNKEWKLIAQTTDTFLSDNLFSEKDGQYRYRIRTAYTEPHTQKVTYSPETYSETYNLERFLDVTFNISIRNGGTPDGVQLHLISDDGLYNQEFSRVTDNDGKIILADVFTETYILTLTKSGYHTIVDTLSINKSNVEFDYAMDDENTMYSYDAETNELFQNFPNPFNPSTEIRFSIKEDSKVDLNIYNIKGQLVKALVEGQTLSAGYHRVRWDGLGKYQEPVPSGVYFYHLNISNSSGNYQKKMKMIMLK